MKRIVCVVLLAAFVAALAVCPVGAEPELQSTRDDVLVLYDGEFANGDENVIKLQFSCANPVGMSENEEYVLHGTYSLLVDMPEETDNGFPMENFAFLLKIPYMDHVNVQEYPISELAFYNHMETGPKDVIQINYVDPNNSANAGDDSYNKDFSVANLDTGWHRLQHEVMKSKLAGWTCDPTNISHTRVAWRTDKDNYQEIDWSFDCLIIAKQSFFDDRAAAETETAAMVAALTMPTVENYDEVKESIEAAKSAIDANREEFPNFLIDNFARWDEIWSAYQSLEAQAAAAKVIAAIDAIGEITAENADEQAALIEAADAELETFYKTGFRRSLITNLDELTAAKDQLAAVRVAAKIDALPAVDELTLEDENALIEAMDAYSDLTVAQRDRLSDETFQKLTALQERMTALLHPYTPGDINGDEAINASDALMALQHSVKLIDLSGDAYNAADVNGDDEVNASDALLILQYSVKLIDRFPVEDRA